MKIPDGFDLRFRQLTPLMLFGVLLAVVLAPWLPGAAWFEHTFGAGFVTRAAVAVLAFYVLVLWGESIRLHTMLTGVLQAFRDFDGNRGRDPAAGKNPRARLEAAKLLIAALKSDDAEIRATSHHNLQRLAGKDLGTDPTAWSAWLAEQDR